VATGNANAVAATPHLVTGGTVSIRTTETDIGNMNPALGLTYGEEGFSLFVYDRLVTVGAGGKVLPYLASRWKEAGNTYTFTIKQGATCSDGTPVTPSVIANSLRYEANPKIGSFGTPLTFGPSGVTISSNNAAHTLTITTHERYVDILSGLAQPNAAIICPKGLAHPAAMQSAVFGSGPYTLEKSTPGYEYVLKARPGYNWGPSGATSHEPGMPGTINFQVVTDETTAANFLSTGEINIAEVQGQDVKRLLSDKSLSQIGTNIPGGDGLVLNETAGHPGANPTVRKAIMMAVDPSDYSDASSSGNSEPVDTLLTPGMRCYNPAVGSSTVKYDPTAATRLLESIGYKMVGSELKKNGIPLTIDIIGLSSQNSGPQYLLSALDSVGIDAKIGTTTDTVFLNDTFSTGNWDLEVYQFAGTFTTPYFMGVQISGTTPPAGINVAHIKNATYNALQSKALLQGGAKSCATWNAGFRAILKDADVKPLTEEHLDWFGNRVHYSVELSVGPNPFSLRQIK
jgi:peptide/nickel transport system substrate-binding protein